MKISIVTTMYNSSPYIQEFYERITKEAKKITDDYEIVFVNDGSPDDSVQKAISLYELDKKVKVIDLSRNYGHHKAIMTGLAHANGDFVFLIDIDFEEEPELLGDFWHELRNNEDVDVVFGVQKIRKGGWFERHTGGLFWKTFNMLSHTKVTENPLTVRLMKSDYTKELVKYNEADLFLAGVFKSVGFNQKPIEVNKKSKGLTNYSLIKKINLLNNGIVSFSSFPLYISFYVGAFISFISLLIGVILIFNRLLGIVYSGWTSLMVSIWFLGGVILFAIGLLGLYLAKIFNEVKNRPLVIKKIYRSFDE